MAARNGKRWIGRVYLGTDETGRQLWDWVGRFATKRERDNAVAKRKLELAGEIEQAKRPPGERVTCDEYADETLARMEDGRLPTRSGRRFKDVVHRHEPRQCVPSRPSSAAGRASELSSATRRPLGGAIPRTASWRWWSRCSGGPWTRSCSTATRFEGSTRRTKGRALDEYAADRGGDGRGSWRRARRSGPYAAQMRALLTFAAYTGMRPGELFARKWTDIDLAANRVQVCAAASTKAGPALPKSNKERTYRAHASRTGKRCYSLRAFRQTSRRVSLFLLEAHGQAPLAAHHDRVLGLASTARAGLDFDFYLASKAFRRPRPLCEARSAGARRRGADGLVAGLGREADRQH